jgi:hypothetical protein
MTVAVGGDGALISAVEPMSGTKMPPAAPEGFFRRIDPCRQNIDRHGDPAPTHSTYMAFL